MALAARRRDVMLTHALS